MKLLLALLFLTSMVFAQCDDPEVFCGETVEVNLDEWAHFQVKNTRGNGFAVATSRHAFIIVAMPCGLTTDSSQIEGWGYDQVVLPFLPVGYYGVFVRGQGLFSLTIYCGDCQLPVQGDDTEKDSVESEEPIAPLIKKIPPWPNPFQYNLNLAISQAPTDSIRVFNILGQDVTNAVTFSQDAKKVSLYFSAQLPTGIYLIKVGKLSIFKVVKIGE